MGTKTYIAILLLSSLPGLLVAQHSLQQETTLPRTGDEYIKAVLEFAPAEKVKDVESVKSEKKDKKKEKQKWNLKKLKEKKKKKTYTLKINTPQGVKEMTIEETIPDYTVSHFEDREGNLVTGENNMLYRRKLFGDSLLETGYETPTMRVRYTSPLLVMKFPMELGTEYHSSFAGRGVKDSRISTIHTGTAVTTVDEFGEMILPQGDTLFSVIRVHESRTEHIWNESLTGRFNINAPVNLDSLKNGVSPSDVITTDTYQWYEEGYRYPVFETVQSYRILKDTVYPIREATYVYAPYEQEFLKEDPSNEKIKKEKKEKKEKEKQAKKDNPEETILTQPLEYNFSPNPVADILNLKFRTQQAGETMLILYDLSGRKIWSQSYPAEDSDRNETLSMSSYPAGAYLLQISCKEQSATEKIIKK